MTVDSSLLSVADADIDGIAIVLLFAAVDHIDFAFGTLCPADFCRSASG
jgi:hypothetical protein